MDDSKWSIYIYEKLLVIVYSSKNEFFSHFFWKSNIFKYVSMCQTRSYDFWIMNIMCTFMYLFVVYFAFAPVISANIHHNVNYFDIQILKMVTETETLTSTLHYNMFTYLDYVFSATFTLILLIIILTYFNLCWKYFKLPSSRAFFMEVLPDKRHLLRLLLSFSSSSSSEQLKSSARFVFFFLRVGCFLLEPILTGSAVNKQDILR